MAEWIIAVVGGKRQTQDTASPINYFCPAVGRTGCKKRPLDHTQWFRPRLER